MSGEPPTIVFLIRHGETAWNVEEVFRGRADVPLNDRGHAEAEAIARALAGEGVTAVYSSPLQRAMATAHPIAASHGLEVLIDERLTDMSFGAWEGRPLAEVRRAWPELFAHWERDPGGVVFPDGESLPLVRERAMGAVEELAARHQGETIAVVSHRVVTKLVVLALFGLDNSRFWQIRQDNACINRLERGKEWVVVGTNDLCHLRDLPAERKRDF